MGPWRLPAIASVVVLALAGVGAVVLACASGGGTDDTYGDGSDEGGSGGDATAGDGGGSDGGPRGDGGRPVEAGCPTACPCSAMGPPTDCTAAMSLGTLTPGQMATATGNIVPTGSQAYVTVTFTGNTSPGYHPQIVLTSGATEFAFDVTSDCMGTLLSCGDLDASAGNATWEEFYEGGDPNNLDAFAPIPPTGNDGGVMVRVYRRMGMPATCNQYTLTVSE